MSHSTSKQPHAEMDPAPGTDMDRSEFCFDGTEDYVDRAMAWYLEHKPHVDRLMKHSVAAFPPSGSDVLRPELWKAESWRWLLAFAKQH